MILEKYPYNYRFVSPGGWTKQEVEETGWTHGREEKINSVGSLITARSTPGCRFAKRRNKRTRAIERSEIGH